MKDFCDDVKGFISVMSKVSVVMLSFFIYTVKLFVIIGHVSVLL